MNSMAMAGAITSLSLPIRLMPPISTIATTAAVTTPTTIRFAPIAEDKAVAMELDWARFPPANVSAMQNTAYILASPFGNVLHGTAPPFAILPFYPVTHR